MEPIIAIPTLYLILAVIFVIGLVTAFLMDIRNLKYFIKKLKNIIETERENHTQEREQRIIQLRELHGEVKQALDEYLKRKQQFEKQHNAPAWLGLIIDEIRPLWSEVFKILVSKLNDIGDNKELDDEQLRNEFNKQEYVELNKKYHHQMGKLRDQMVKLREYENEIMELNKRHENDSKRKNDLMTTINTLLKRNEELVERNKHLNNILHAIGWPDINKQPDTTDKVMQKADITPSTPESETHNPQSEIPTPQSAIPIPQSAIPNPQSETPTPQSEIPKGKILLQCPECETKFITNKYNPSKYCSRHCMMVARHKAKKSQSAIPTPQSEIETPKSAIETPQSEIPTPQSEQPG